MEKSQAWLSRASGVPASTLSYVARGLRDLPTQYVDSIRNVYQSEAYNRLKFSGLSSSQANRFKWYTPESVLNTQANMTLKVDYLTIGHIGQKLKNLGRSATEKEILDLWDESREETKSALQKSKQPVENIFDY
jgi:hypothetical protein